jgi:hypothetical protein
MQHKLLLPNKYKKAGWIILIPAFIFGVILIATDFSPVWLHAKVFSLFPDNGNRLFKLADENLTNTIIGVFFIAGALLVGFTKEKNEDEFISNIRLSSLLWAVLVNYILLIIAFLFIYESAFLSVMMYNMFTVLLIFIIRFNYVLYKYSKSASDEK